MKKYISIVLGVIVLVSLIIVVPASASAASVRLETAKTDLSVGDTAVITIKVDAEGKTINTIEGNVVFTSPALNLAVQEFSLANSAFGLWPRTPSLSADAKVVSFVGGVPGGFSIEGATLFKMIVEAKSEGTITISPEDFAAYINDGSGTKVSMQAKGLTMKVGPKKAGSVVNNEWQTIVAADKTAPEDFIIVMGQDESLFDGRKFAFFSALDNQSGIDHYEVSENGAPAVRSGSTYVLTTQDGVVNLQVTAFDKAGNKKVASYSGEPKADGISWLSIIVVVLAVVIVRFVFKRLRRKNKNVASSIPSQQE